MKLDYDTAEFVCDNIRRADRANKPKSMAQIIDLILEMRPELSRKQAYDAYNSNVKGRFSDLLTGIVVAQPTTTKRSAINVPQQWRWHTLVEHMWDDIIHHNRDVAEEIDSPAYRSAFLKIMEHFIWNLDEECVMAKDGVVRIVGDKLNPKHEANIDDSRVCLTMVRTGNAAGNNGPTGFLAAGERKRAGFTDEFLVENGALAHMLQFAKRRCPKPSVASSPS